MPIFDPDNPKDTHMKFNPKTEDELNADQLMPNVEYDFEVVRAEDKVSKKGNDMIALELSVFTPSGKRRKIMDWLVAAMEFKLRHFAFGVGLGDAYQAGGIGAAECFGRTGRLTLRAERDAIGDRLVVKDYVESGAAKREPVKQPANSAPAPAAAGTDEPPF